MKIPKNKIVIAISFLMFYMFATFQFYNDYSLYINLKESGKSVSTKVEYYKSMGSWMYNLSFETLDGKVITHEGKCGELEKCKKEYDNLKVIYLPKNPEQFMELPHYENYSFEYKIFFYFMLYGAFGGWIFSSFINLVYHLRKKENRTEILRLMNLTKNK